MKTLLTNWFYLLSTLVVWLLCFSLSDGQCTYGTPFSADTTWADSGKGDLTLTATTMTGFTVTSGIASPATFNNWQCHLQVGNTIVHRSVGVIDVYTLPFYAYLCMEITPHSNTGFTYQLKADKEADLNNARIKTRGNATVVTLISEVCIASDLTTPEFYTMVGKTNPDLAKIAGPEILFADFTYVFDDGTANCGFPTTSSDWAACGGSWTRDQWTFDYTKCANKQANSAGGVVNVVAQFNTASTTYYVVVYNKDSAATITGNADVSQFTCYVFGATSSGGLVTQVAGTQKMNHCVAGQSATLNGDAKITAQPATRCPITTTTSTTTTIPTTTTPYTGPPTSAPPTTAASGVEPAADNTIMLVAGALGGLLFLLIAALIAVIVYCKLKNRKQQKVDLSKGDPETANGDVHKEPKDPPASNYKAEETPAAANMPNTEDLPKPLEPVSNGSALPLNEVHVPKPLPPISK